MRLRLVVFTTAWLLSSGFVVAGLTGTITNPSAQPEQRRFLGLDGDYLPFDTDDAILDFLSTAEIVSRERIPVGVTRPDEVVLEKDGIRARAAYKDIDERYQRARMNDGSFFMNLRDYFMFERAAYELAQMLGLDNVPPTVIRRFGRDRASLQLWIENSMTELDRANEGPAASERLAVDPTGADHVPLRRPGRQRRPQRRRHRDRPRLMEAVDDRPLTSVPGRFQAAQGGRACVLPPRRLGEAPSPRQGRGGRSTRRIPHGFRAQLDVRAPRRARGAHPGADR